VRRGRGWVSVLAGVFSGLLFALAFPPYGAVVLLPLALIPWLVALSREESRWRALVSGAVFGLVYWCASIPWIVYVVTHYGGQSAPMGIVCLVLLALILAEWPAAVAWATVTSAPPSSPWRLAFFPLFWAASEHLRCVVYKGFPWNLTGHALFRHPIWLQSASLWGVVGVGAFVVAVAALLARTIAARTLVPAAGAVALVLGAGVFGAWRISRPVPGSEELRVALLQPNLTEETRSSSAGAVAGYQSVLAQADEASDNLPALIVLPESALPVYWQRSEKLRQDLATIAMRGSAVLFNDVEEDPDGHYYNSARLLTTRGVAHPSYRKVHLVPFGEYVPLPKIFFFVRQISSEIGAFSAASEPALLKSGPFVIGVGVCYEILYPSLARREVADGANLLATISNDSWYGRAGAQEQHFAGAVLRSVENSRYLMRAAITGISGIVDARGRILEESPADERTIISGDVRLVEERTVWTRWGYALPTAADVAAGVVLLYGLFRLRRGAPRAESKTSP
jgi:apolipoprotein N-acyltransferase